MKLFAVPVLLSAFLTTGVSEAAEYCHPDETEKMVKEAAARESASYGGSIQMMTAHSLSSRKNIWIVTVRSELDARVYEVETDDSGCEIVRLQDFKPADGPGCWAK